MEARVLEKDSRLNVFVNLDLVAQSVKVKEQMLFLNLYSHSTAVQL